MLELHKKTEPTSKWIPVTNSLPKEDEFTAMGMHTEQTIMGVPISKVVQVSAPFDEENLYGAMRTGEW